MKKKLLLSLLLALTLLLALPGTARAETLVSLGSFPAGSEVDIALLQSDELPDFFADGLPQGLRVEREERGGTNLLIVRGTPLYAGDYRFTVEAGEVVVCAMSIVPAAPVVTVPSDCSCVPGETVDLRLSASTPDGGTLSYQWYLSRGPVNELIEGATGNVLRPDTSAPGTTWYCCEVVNTNNGLSTSRMSDYICVTVAEPEIQSISIESLPVKTDYLVGDELDVAGLRILVRYEGGRNEIIDEGFTISPAVFTSAGTHSVTVGYEGFRCGFNVMVKTREESVTGIGVLTLPRKTEYAPGEDLQTAGLSIRCYTEDGGHFDVSSGLDCSPTWFDKEGEQTVTVTYAEKTCTFTVRVKEDKVVTGISVLTMPSTRSYTVGDRLDITGLTIQVNSNKGSEILTEGFTVMPKVLATPGTQEISVLYGQFRTRFNVTVKAREAVTPTPRPTPAPTDAPEASPGTDTSPAPEQSAQPVPTPPVRKNTGVNTAVKIIFAIAVLALAGLAAYVWYLRKQGFEDEQPDEPEELDTVSGEPMDDERGPDEK